MINPHDKILMNNPSQVLDHCNAPTIHWHTVSSPVEDEPAHRVIERLTDEAYHFGQQMEAYECRLLDGQQGLEEFVQQEQKAKDDALANVQSSLQQINA